MLTLVEKAEAAIKEEDAEAMAKRMMSAKFDFNDFLKQYKMVSGMGSMASIMKMLPGARACQLVSWCPMHGGHCSTVIRVPAAFHALVKAQQRHLQCPVDSYIKCMPVCWAALWQLSGGTDSCLCAGCSRAEPWWLATLQA